MKKHPRSRVSKKSQYHLSHATMTPLAVLIALYCSPAMADTATVDASSATPTDSLSEIVVTGLRQQL